MKWFLAAVIALGAASASAQDNNIQPSASAPTAGAPSASAPAMHLRVDDGVFQLGNGASIDLTDRRILFATSARSGAYKITSDRVYTSINGAAETMRVGDRLDLKSFKSTQNFLTDKSICFVDLLRTEKAMGEGQFTAVFRFFCE